MDNIWIVASLTGITYTMYIKQYAPTFSELCNVLCSLPRLHFAPLILRASFFRSFSFFFALSRSFSFFFALSVLLDVVTVFCLLLFTYFKCVCVAVFLSWEIPFFFGGGGACLCHLCFFWVHFCICCLMANLFYFLSFLHCGFQQNCLATSFAYFSEFYIAPLGHWNNKINFVISTSTNSLRLF